MNIGILFGGNSLEHEISIISAFQVKNKIKDKYNVIMIYSDFNSNIFDASKCNLNNFKKKKIKGLRKTNFKRNGIKNKKIDIMILLGHGENSEDGVFQGLMRFYSIPYIGSDLFASSLSIDKWMSYLFLKKDIPMLEKINYNENDFLNNKKINYPLMIIKPRFGGSSIGIQICKKEEAYPLLGKVLYEYKDVIIEPFIDNVEEYTQAISNNYISKIEVIKKNNYYDFNEKYSSDNKFIAKRFITDIELDNLSRKIYNLINASGIIRIDYFKINNKYYLNEINTLPGALGSYLFDNFIEVLEDEIKISLNKNIKIYDYNGFLMKSNIEK